MLKMKKWSPLQLLLKSRKSYWYLVRTQKLILSVESRFEYRYTRHTTYLVPTQFPQKIILRSNEQDPPSAMFVGHMSYIYILLTQRAQKHSTKQY